MINTLLEMPGGPARREFAAVPPVPDLAVRRILLPFDLSNLSVCALRLAAKYAEQTGAALHLLHVVAPARAAGIEANSSRSEDALAESAERLLKQWAARIVQGRARTFVSIRIGDLVDVIIARAAATHADLIVMTSRSCSGIKNDMQRSSAERVSRLAPCPVLTIPEKCARPIAYANNESLWPADGAVLMPVDFSSAAERALPLAAAIAARREAALLLAHGSDIERAGEYAVHGQLNSWAEGILGPAFPFETAVWPGGHSLYAILSEAVRADAQLIVLPTSAQPWTERLRAGSITDGVLRQAPCPVLSVNSSSGG